MSTQTANPFVPAEFNNPDDMIEFIIGKGTDIQKFSVHREVVYCNSPVLRANLAGVWQEEITTEYRIDDTTKEIFQMMVQFMYGGDIYLDMLKHGVVFTRVWDTDCENLVHLWMLGHKYSMPRLQNLVMDKIAFMFDKKGEDAYVPAFLLGYIYNNTFEGSHLRRFIADQFVNIVVFDRRAADDYPKEAMVDVYEILAAIRRLKAPRPTSDFYVDENEGV